MYCRYCGASIDDDSVYCEQCGKRLIVSNISQTPIVKAPSVPTAVTIESGHPEESCPPTSGYEAPLSDAPIGPYGHQLLYPKGVYTGEAFPGLFVLATFGMFVSAVVFVGEAVMNWEKNIVVSLLDIGLAFWYGMILILALKRKPLFRILYLALWALYAFIYLFAERSPLLIPDFIVGGLWSLYFFKSTKINLYLAYRKRGDNNVL